MRIKNRYTKDKPAPGHEYKPLTTPTPEQVALFAESAATIVASYSGTSPVTSRSLLYMEGVAGCGKTSTTVENIVRLNTYGARQRVVAFGTKAAAELSARLAAAGLPAEIATTCHVYGKEVVKSQSPAYARARIDQYKIANICEHILKVEDWSARKRIERAASLFFANLLFNPNTPESETDDYETALALVDDHDLLDGVRGGDPEPRTRPQLVDMARTAMLASLRDASCIDFDDMVCLPYYLGLTPKEQLDILHVDEYQDTNRAQEYLVYGASSHVAVIGDPDQAIYAFRGAGSSSMSRAIMIANALDMQVKPLSLTFNWRCDWRIVEFARQLVPRIQCRPNADLGVVGVRSQAGILADVAADLSRKESSYILCRVNANLFSYAVGFLKAGIPACRVGGQGGTIDTVLKRIIQPLTALRTMDAVGLAVEKARIDALAKLTVAGDDDDRATKSSRLRAKKNRINDLYDCVDAIASFCSTPAQLPSRLAELAPKKPVPGAAQLMTVHASKGLEARNVYIVGTDKLGEDLYTKDDLSTAYSDLDDGDGDQTAMMQCETPFINTDIDTARVQAPRGSQERNIAYVALTRAQRKLVFEIEPPPWLDVSAYLH